MTDLHPASRLELWKTRLGPVLSIVRNGVPFGIGVIAALAAALLYQTFSAGDTQITADDVDEAVAAALASATAPPAFSAQVYQVIQPSLVLIQSDVPGTNGDAETSLGAGVIINDSGDILTSLHVVQEAANIQLIFADGTKSSAQMTATQAENDIAVVRAEQLPELLVPATLGNPNSMHVGDEVFAVGNPFGLYSSISAGVISGFNRSFLLTNSNQRLEGLIQIDAAVNPGNSGGPLLNRNGQVIGIITGIINPTEQEVFIGIGFAVPINIAGGAAGLPPY